jgi:hypothetical protein
MVDPVSSATAAQPAAAQPAGPTPFQKALDAAITSFGVAFVSQFMSKMQSEVNQAKQSLQEELNS